MRTKALDSVTELALQLKPAQIEAAQKLYNRMPEWRAANEALVVLGEKFPGFDLPAVLLKAVAVNQLYSTNVYAIVHMGRHLHSLLSRVDLHTARHDLVDRMAEVRMPDGKTFRWRSFASKFANFYIDSTRFPILDGNANTTISLHLGLRGMASTYVEYASRHEQLMKLAGLRCSNIELDRYLWLAGYCRPWRSQRTRVRYGELRELLEEDDAAITEEVDALLGIDDTASTRST